MATSLQTQLGAALALTQLLHEYPTLERLNWNLPRDGFFAGSLQGELLMTEDASPVVKEWQEVLGGHLDALTFTSEITGEPRRAFHLVARWRDVRVDVHVSCPVAALTGSAVAA